MVLKLSHWRSRNLLPTFGAFHELENSLREPFNGLGHLKGSQGGARKPTWRWNLKIFFHGINFYYKRGYFCEKRGCKSSKTKKFFFFAQIPHAFIQCSAIHVRSVLKTIQNNDKIFENVLKLFVFNSKWLLSSYDSSKYTEV